MPTTVPQLALALRNILVATDFSACSERALLHAIAAAHHCGSTLHFVHVVQPEIFSILPPEAYIGTPDALAMALKQANAEVDTLVIDVLQRTHCEDLKHRIWVQQGASVSDTLRAIIEREHIDLAVVGTHGRTGLRRLVLGSVAEGVFRYAPCPVLTVGPHSWRSDPQSVYLKHVLFPTDFSPDSARALPIAMAVATDFGATLTLLNIIERFDGEATHDRPRVVAALEQRMHDMVCAVGPVPPGTVFQVEFGEVADTVIEAVTRLGVDLVVFGLKAPDTYVDRLPWMNAYKIVCEVGCPVLSLRGPSLPGSE
ncbi:MAG: universal stress protein [Acidobacteriia bacterium]|nr:universal stress protein [Terriglobia bacterium]